MFTGLIQGVGRLARRERRGGDQRILIAGGGFAVTGAAPGDSIAVNGACLTVTALENDGFWADVSRETLAHTTLSGLARGAALNLESALTLSRKLGGHLMSGHVDGVGGVIARADEGRSVRISVQAPAALVRYIARKGSIAVDGISLTVNSVEGRRFEVNIVPHTLEATNLGGAAAGTAVNLEVDLLARYVERLMQSGDNEDDNLTQLLMERGFMQSEGKQES